MRTTKDTFDYETYGKVTRRTGISDVIFLYNGRDGVVIDSNGLIYMRARYYSPELHRFINADILAGDIANAITLNRYAYANGNPVSLIDPRGLSAERNAIVTDSVKTFQASAPNSSSKNYSNSYETITDENGNIEYYDVTSIITMQDDTYTLNYTINTGGAIAFRFADNEDYDELLAAGGNEYLAEAMYDQAKEIDEDALDGRTIDGIGYELALHYQLRMIPGIDEANIGSTDENNAGYDHNAWVSETVAVAANPYVTAIIFSVGIWMLVVY